MNMRFFVILIIIYTLAFLSSCHDDWLNVKPDKKLIVPADLKELRALMDNSRVMQAGYPVIGEISADDYYITSNVWNGIGTLWEKNSHIWKSDIYEDITIKGVTDDWSWPYQRVYYTNLVLEKLNQMSSPDVINSEEYRNVYGTALFHRSWAFYQLSQLFCEQYKPSYAHLQDGVPLRVKSDISIKSSRSTLEQTYEQITNDLLKAVIALPIQSGHQLRPTRAAALALLARVYVTMGKYNDALSAVEKCFLFRSGLLDYNIVDGSIPYPFSPENNEVIFRNIMSSAAIFRGTYYVSKELYDSYDDGDLRKVLFFRADPSGVIYKGSYEGGTGMFAGLTTSELYLIKSECLYRLGNKKEAVSVLTEFLEKRYNKNEISQLNSLLNSKEFLSLVISERRKEMVFRGVRWGDLKRFNEEKNHAKDISRDIDGKKHYLRYDSKNWVLPIPEVVVELNEMQNNFRD